MNKAKLDISKNDLEFILDVLKRHLSNFKFELYAFGSRVDGSAKPGSDLDLLLCSTSEIKSSTIEFIREEFENSDLHYAVDLIDASKIEDDFKKIISPRMLCLLSTQPAKTPQLL